MAKISDFLNHNFYFVFYSELGGGHHLGNLISLDRSFFPLGADHHDALYQGLLNWYNDPTSIYAHAFPVHIGHGHTTFNQEIFNKYIDTIDYEKYKNSTHPSHAHNLFKFDTQQLKNKSMIILTLHDPVSRDIINHRSKIRYSKPLLISDSGEFEHSGYIFEKYIYSRETAIKHLGFDDYRIFEIEIRDFYKSDITPIINNINKFYNLNIPLDQAQELHNLWQRILWR